MADALTIERERVPCPIPLPVDGVPVRFRFANGRQGIAYRHGDWLKIDVIVHGRRRTWPRAAEAWRLLARNAGLPPALAYAVNARRQVLLRAEARIEDPRADSRQLLASLTTQLDAVLDEGKTTDPGRETDAAADPESNANSRPDSEADPDTWNDLATPFAEAGWPLLERVGGSPEVALADRHVGRFAQVARVGDVLHAAFDVIDDKPDWGGPSCRRASGVFLLRATAAMRLVRACTPSARAHVSPRFETWLQTPTARGVEHAFGALSTTAELFGREFAALAADEAVAGTYLSTHLSTHLSARVTHDTNVVPSSTQE